jgi:hypothetical protein
MALSTTAALLMIPALPDDQLLDIALRHAEQLRRQGQVVNAVLVKTLANRLEAKCPDTP